MTVSDCKHVGLSECEVMDDIWYVWQVSPSFCTNLAVHNFSTPLAMDSFLQAKSSAPPSTTSLRSTVITDYFHRLVEACLSRGFGSTTVAPFSTNSTIVPTYTDNPFRPHRLLTRQTNRLILSVISYPCWILGGGNTVVDTLLMYPMVELLYSNFL